MRISGVVHAGAHTGEEVEAYEACGIEHVLWIEANPDLMGALNEHVYPFGHVTVCACVGARDGDKVTFHISDSADGRNQGESSSVLPLGTHARVHPEVKYVGERPMVTQTLAGLLAKNWPWDTAPNFMNLDLQGYELECLKGAEPVLKGFDWIFTEINEDALYEGCALLPELTQWLEQRNFRLVQKALAGLPGHDQASTVMFGWGEALFARNR